MTTLYLAEKPSQAKDIATVIGITGRKDGYYDLKGGDFMSYAVGHLLESVDPPEYNPAWKAWNLEQLPLIPQVWKVVPVKRTAKQLAVIKALLAKVDRVVICTDPGREGELIAREILHYYKFKGKIDRFWTSALVHKDIVAALAKLKPGSETKPLYEAALARQKSDWIMGMSGTRAITVLFNKKGQVYNFGRVQSPTLAMVVRRDREIKNFVKKDYFEIEATVTTKTGESFTMMHSPDAEHRIYSEKDALLLKAKAEKYSGPLKVDKSKESEYVKGCFSLPMLQREANKALGFTAKHTLKIAQELYDSKFTSYPRTDCGILSESLKGEVPATLDAVAKLFPAAVAELKSQGITFRKASFDDSKLTDHHGIVPTTVVPVDLNKDQLALYTLITQRYLQVLAQDCLSDATKVSLDANGVLFKTSGKIITQQGFKAIKLTSK